MLNTLHLHNFYVNYVSRKLEKQNYFLLLKKIRTEGQKVGMCRFSLPEAQNLSVEVFICGMGQREWRKKSGDGLVERRYTPPPQTGEHVAHCLGPMK